MKQEEFTLIFFFNHFQIFAHFSQKVYDLAIVQGVPQGFDLGLYFWINSFEIKELLLLFFLVMRNLET